MTPTTAGSTAHPILAARVRQEARALWQLAWPILIGQLATVGLSVVAVMMAGHASAQDLAGVSLGASIWHITTTTVIGVMMAINPIVAHMVGAGDHAQVPHAVRQALWKALAVGLVAVALMNGAALVFDHLALEPSVRALARGFVGITSLGLPAYAGYRVLYGYSASLNQTKPMMVIAVTALLLNGVISALLVYGLFGLPRRAPYASAKWAIRGLTRTLAQELGPHGVRVNCICAGSVGGERIDRVIAAEAAKTGVPESTVRGQYTDAVSLRTFVSADDIANTILFLTSAAGARISGQDITVDGHTETF